MTLPSSQLPSNAPKFIIDFNSDDENLPVIIINTSNIDHTIYKAGLKALRIAMNQEQLEPQGASKYPLLNLNPLLKFTKGFVITPAKRNISFYDSYFKIQKIIQNIFNVRVIPDDSTVRNLNEIILDHDLDPNLKPDLEKLHQNLTTALIQQNLNNTHTQPLIPLTAANASTPLSSRITPLTGQAALTAIKVSAATSGIFQSIFNQNASSNPPAFVGAPLKVAPLSSQNNAAILALLTSAPILAGLNSKQYSLLKPTNVPTSLPSHTTLSSPQLSSPLPPAAVSTSLQATPQPPSPLPASPLPPATVGTPQPLISHSQHLTTPGLTTATSPFVATPSSPNPLLPLASAFSPSNCTSLPVTPDVPPKPLTASPQKKAGNNTQQLLLSPSRQPHSTPTRMQNKRPDPLKLQNLRQPSSGLLADQSNPPAIAVTSTKVQTKLPTDTFAKLKAIMTKNDVVAITAAVRKYIPAKSCCAKVRQLFFKIWDAIKSIFGKSEWQIALKTVIKAIMNFKITDASKADALATNYLVHLQA